MVDITGSQWTIYKEEFSFKEEEFIMKLNMKKVAAMAMAATMCMPASVFAASGGTTTPTTTAETSGSFDTSFDVYAQTLTVSVPVAMNVKVNPLADSTATDVKKFEVASDSIDIINASVDADADIGIPVNVTVRATIESVNEDVVTEYNTFTADATSVKKRINLNISQAQTAAVVAAKTGETLAFDTDKKLQLNQFEVTTPAVYTTPVKSTAITQYGSLLSVDIAKPTTSDTTAGATYTTDATKVTPVVGSFAVTGVANTNADWKADDVNVAVTYVVKASKALNITTPAITTAPTFTSGTSAADLTITVPNVGEATVTGAIVHSGEGLYPDYAWEVQEGSDKITVTYAPNATTSTQTDATITLKKDDEALTFLAGDATKTKAQDFLIGLSDGRIIVTTLTVN